MQKKNDDVNDDDDNDDIFKGASFHVNLTHISFSFIYFIIMFSDISIGSLIEPALK